MNPDPCDGLDDDIRDHIERETQDHIDRGMSPGDASLAALRKFGNVARVMEDTRDVWRRVWLDQLLQDLRYGLRFLRRNPRFAAIVTLTMALGIGVNTAIFSVVNTVLLRPVEYPDAARLVWIGAYDPNLRRDFVRNQDYFEWRRLAQSYSGMAAYGLQQPAIRTLRGSSQLTGIFVAGDFWRITAAKPAAGRLFTDAEQDCIVLTWHYFQREFSGDPSIVGRAITLNGHSATVTGVLPADFRFHLPMWWAAAQPEPVEAYLTLPRPGEGIAQSMQVVAALKPIATVQQAQSELSALSQHLGRTDDLRVEPLANQLGGGSRKALLILMAAGACVLLIAIANVANLLLGRATLRHREVAIRAAVGAGRGRVLRQMLAESLLQAMAGGAAGLLLARGAIAVLAGISPYAVPRLAETAIDGRVLLFTLALSLAAGLAFGALPALSLRRGDLQEALKSGARSTSGGGLRLRRLLVAAELALAIVLLTGAALMLKSFARMNAHSPGFDPDDVAVMKVRFTAGRDGDAFVRELLRRLDTLPGVRAAGVSCWIQQRNQRVNAVSPGYLKALGMRLRKGRWLAGDEARVALINESMARRTFGTLDAVARQVLLPRPYTVVGVVADVKYTRLDADPPPEAYIPIERAPDLYGLEIAATPKSILPALSREVRQLDPSLPVFDAKTLGDALSQSIAPRRFNLFLLGGFAAAALLLAVVGIYGVAAYSVTERTREIGMRMALGARRGQVAAMVLRDALPYTIAGIAAGLIATRALAALLASLLYEVQATDPATYAAVALILALVAVASCVGPAWKAASIDPLAALRQVG